MPNVIKKVLRKLTSSDLKRIVFPFDIDYNIAKDKKIHFTFHASSKMGEKAQRDGVENIITRAVYKYTAALSKGLILDVGMNYGFLSTAWASALPQQQIIGFEVSPYLLEAVRKTIHSNHLGNLILEQLAVSNESGTAVAFNFLPGKASRGNSSGLSGLVQTITIDDYLKAYNLPVHAIKIDTDGFDYEVLLGAQSSIEKHRPLVVVETNRDPRIINYFLERNYDIYSMRQQHITSSHIDYSVSEYANVLCYPHPLNI